VIFNFHGYPWLIHKFTYRRTNHGNIHVRGYKEKGNINTPLELAIRNQVDRFNLAIDVIDGSGNCRYAVRTLGVVERADHRKHQLRLYRGAGQTRDSELEVALGAKGKQVDRHSLSRRKAVAHY